MTEPSASNSREPLSGEESELARELFERHRLALYRYLKGLLASREDASEILQETYLRLVRQPSFDHVRANPRAYLFQTATNLAFRQRTLRGLNAEKETCAALGLNPPDWTSWPELALEGDQMASVIVTALEELNDDVREALLLHRFRELTHKEIAARMRLSARTIESYVREGLTHIARRLREKS
jgi:RNA polymerase sigma factor (sigma-70 family)